MAFVVVVFCVLLFLFMRWIGGMFGSSIGTAAGVGLLGVIGLGVAALILVVLLPVLLPAALFAAACFAIFKVATGVSR